MRIFALAVLFGGAVAAATAIAQSSDLAAILAIGLLMASLEIFVLAKIANGFTVAAIPVLAVNSVLFVSAIVWNMVEAEAITGPRLLVPQEDHFNASFIGVWFCAAYTIGAVLAGPRRMNVLAQLGPSISQMRKLVTFPNGALVAVGYSAIFLAIYAWQGALLRGQYLHASGPTWAVILSSAAAPLAVLTLSLVAAQSGSWRWIAAAGIVIIVLIYFARATRTLALVPGLVIFAHTLSTGGTIRKRSVVVGGFLTVLLLQIPLVGRGNPGGVGIIPLGEQLLTRPGEVFSGFSLGGLLGNILYAGPQTAATAQRPIPSQAFWISVNPMPGGLAGWHDIRKSLRLNVWQPYNALGELAAHGWIKLAIFAALAGFVIAFATRSASNLRGNYRIVAALFVLGATLFFSLNLIQYNLRSATRSIWYILALLVLIWLASTILRSRESIRDSVKGLESADRCVKDLAG